MRPREELLQRLQTKAFAYIEREARPLNGLVLDKTAPGSPASIAATGLALASYPVAVERSFLAQDEAVRRTLATLRFFRDSHQGSEAHATGYRGFYYHFLDMETGRRVWQCELSTVDSAFLIAGMLAAATYFTGASADQREIRDIAFALYDRVDWRWMQTPNGTICHGWRPENGFIPHQWQGYDEGLLLYVLALGSRTNPLPPQSFAAWASTYEWKKYYDIEYLYSGPLFTHQLSHCWIDFRGIQDAFMRSKGIDYFENSRRATLVQQRYAKDNPHRFAGYGTTCWGVTASDGPGPADLTIDGMTRRFWGYEGRGAPDGLDDGTIAPWAVVASLPFAPEIVLPAVHYFVETLRLHDQHPYGFKASFNRTFRATEPADIAGWSSPYFYGLNIGPILLMIENYRSGMLWQLMRDCPPIKDGLRRAGFSGGWLERAPPSGT